MNAPTPALLNVFGRTSRNDGIALTRVGRPGRWRTASVEFVRQTVSRDPPAAMSNLKISSWLAPQVDCFTQPAVLTVSR
jgi:hypothetical protein